MNDAVKSHMIPHRGSTEEWVTITDASVERKGGRGGHESIGLDTPKVENAMFLR